MRKEQRLSGVWRAQQLFMQPYLRLCAKHAARDSRNGIALGGKGCGAEELLSQNIGGMLAGCSSLLLVSLVVSFA